MRRATRNTSAPRIGHVGILLDCPQVRACSPGFVGKVATIIGLVRSDNSNCHVRIDDDERSEAIIPFSAFLSEFSSLYGPESNVPVMDEPSLQAGFPMEIDNRQDGKAIKRNLTEHKPDRRRMNSREQKSSTKLKHRSPENAKQASRKDRRGCKAVDQKPDLRENSQDLDERQEDHTAPAVDSSHAQSAFSPVTSTLLETAQGLATLKETVLQLTALHQQPSQGTPVPRVAKNKPRDSRKKKSCCPICILPWGDSSMIQCDGCDLWIHTKCDDISSQKLSRLKKDKSAKYFCSICRTIEKENVDVPLGQEVPDAAASSEALSGIFTSICVLVSNIQENRRKNRRIDHEQQGEPHQRPSWQEQLIEPIDNVSVKADL